SAHAIAGAQADGVHPVVAVRKGDGGAEPISVSKTACADSRERVERAKDLLLHRPGHAALEVIRLRELERVLNVASRLQAEARDAKQAVGKVHRGDDAGERRHVRGYGVELADADRRGAAD